MAESFIYGKDCPKGYVQVEHVGHSPKDRQSDYGWKPQKGSVMLEVYVDGQRFCITAGDFHDGVAQRRGLHIVASWEIGCEKTSLNAASVFYPQGNAGVDSSRGGEHG